MIIRDVFYAVGTFIRSTNVSLSLSLTHTNKQTHPPHTLTNIQLVLTQRFDYRFNGKAINADRLCRRRSCELVYSPSEPRDSPTTGFIILDKPMPYTQTYFCMYMYISNETVLYEEVISYLSVYIGRNRKQRSIEPIPSSFVRMSIMYMYIYVCVSAHERMYDVVKC